MSIVLFLLASILLAFPATAAQSAPVNLQLALNWKAEPEFGGFTLPSSQGISKTRAQRRYHRRRRGHPGRANGRQQQSSFWHRGWRRSCDCASARRRRDCAICRLPNQPAGNHGSPGAGIQIHRRRIQFAGNPGDQNGAPHTLFLQAKFGKAKVKLVPYPGGIATFLTNSNLLATMLCDLRAVVGEEKIGSRKKFSDCR